MMFNNKVMKSAAILLGSFFIAGMVAAKEIKIGFVNVQAIAEQIPQAAAIQDAIRNEFGGKIEEVTKLERDIAFNIEKLRRDGPTMSDKQKEDLTAQINQQRQQYENLARPLDEDIRTRQLEERNKVLALIQNAINVVAEREKYDVVLNSGAAVYAKPEFDLSAAVVEQVSKAR